MKRIILSAVIAVLAGCATVDPAALERLEAAAVKTYRDTAAAVTLGAMSKEAGAKVQEEADRLARQYAALAIINGLPAESAAVKEAREALVAALK